MEPTSRIRLLTTDPDWILVDRYFSGECTPDEAKAIDAWALADPSHARLLASMRRVWLEAAAPLPVFDEPVAWRSLRERLNASPPRVTPLTRSTPKRRSLVWRWLGVAASLAAVGVGLIVARRHANERQLAAQPSQVYTAARGQRSEVTLVDGTRVWLNVDSRLRVAQGYGASVRDVNLVGEAYFVVQHDRRRPFLVHAGFGVLEDLGTEFSVRAYPGDTGTVVTVAGGRVAFGAAEIDSGQMGTLDQGGRVTVSDHVDIEAARAWIGGELRFSEVPLRDVVRDLQRWYDVDVAIDDSALLSVPVTASFSTQSADEALEIITATLGVHYTRDGRSVRIQRQRGRLR